MIYPEIVQFKLLPEYIIFKPRTLHFHLVIIIPKTKAQM